MAAEAEKLVLKWPYLSIALLPILVYVGTDLFLHHYGELADGLLPTFLPFDAHGEAAGRLNLLGAFVLFIGVAIAALAYFASTVLLLSVQSRLIMLGYFAALMLLGGWIISALDTRQMQDYMGPSFVCAALGHAPQPGDGGGAAPSTVKAAQPKAAVPDRRGSEGCENPRFKQLRLLLEAHKYATMLCVAALILGSICCLAGPATGGSLKEKLDHYEAQSERLNIYLYLSALFLVGDLVFAAAYARWPAYVLPAGTGFDAHANAFVGYLGFSYSLLIASFYAPIAALLSSNVKALKPDKETDSLPDAFTGPLQILKIGSAIFSTALAGAVPAILGMGT